MPGEPYDWRVSLQLRMVLSYRGALSLIVAAGMGSRTALQLIEWYGRER